MSAPAAGDTFTAERTFTVAMVEAFTAVSGDAGAHHVVPDDQGRLLVHGLLVASLATEIGGRLDYLARVLDFEFLRPVRTGDTVRVTMQVDEAIAEPGRTRLRLSGHGVNQVGKEVMTVRSTGVILARG
ncbi:MAG TPA: hypothetical protein VHE35_08020 [Kofleriaceae bacterium]|nr:hypothetical protein [Kofleriaceae bacterium]